jgi:hypothetical protein
VTGQVPTWRRVTNISISRKEGISNFPRRLKENDIQIVTIYFKKVPLDVSMVIVLF